MFKKVFEYAGEHKKSIYLASFIMLISVVIGIVPLILVYYIINPFIMGRTLDITALFIIIGLILSCLVMQAVLSGIGHNISHKAAFNTLFRLRVSLQRKMEKLPLGVVEEKGTGAIKKLFVDDVDSLELLLAHSLPEGIANLMVPFMVYIAMFFVDWKLALMSLASIPFSMIAMMTMYSVGMKQMAPYYKANQQMNNTIIEYVNGMEVVKVFNKQAESYGKFTNDVNHYRDYALVWYKSC